MTSSRRARFCSAARSRSSASWRRACRPAMPAASSSTRRRCSGLAWMISPMRPCGRARRARAGGGVGKQHMHVARPHLAAVDPVGRAGVALDPARHVERFMLVELRRRLALGIVDMHRDFGIVARRPVVGAGEDHVVHVGRAHGLVRGLAHDPAQRFHQVRFAAAVGPTTPVSPGSIRNRVGSTKDLKPSIASASVSWVKSSRLGCARWSPIDPGRPPRCEEAANRRRARAQPRVEEGLPHRPGQ